MPPYVHGTVIWLMWLNKMKEEEDSVWPWSYAFNENPK